MEKTGKQELSLVSYAFSSLVFTAKGDSEWLKASFFMLHDILKDTWVFQEVMKEGKAEGKAEGREQELEKCFLQFIEVRFPTLLIQAKQVVEQKTSLEQLEKKLNTLYRANTTEEAEATLLANA